MPIILTTQETEIRRIHTQFKASLEKVLVRHYIKNTQHKKRWLAGGVPQVVEHLPRKCEVLSSIPSAAKNLKSKK
jgi:hypothetical protein